MCTSLLQNGALWDMGWCIVGFVEQVYHMSSSGPLCIHANNTSDMNQGKLLSTQK